MKKPPVTREDRIVFIVQNIDKLILKSFQGGAYSRSTLSEAENEQYWQSYPREAQIRFHSYAPTSAQPIGNKQELEEKRKTIQQSYADLPVSMSPLYCGFRLKPNRFVFYAYRSDELSDVLEYARFDDEWTEQLLSP